MIKEIVEGIILVLSCKKHQHTRLSEFKLQKNNYSGWKVIYVVGDFFLEENYTLKEDLLTIYCEDSYLHLLKKLGLSLKYLYEHFVIKQGVLRSGDDLMFNEQRLESFLLRNNKPDFYGWSPSGKNLLLPTPYSFQPVEDKFMFIIIINIQKILIMNSII